MSHHRRDTIAMFRPAMATLLALNQGKMYENWLFYFTLKVHSGCLTETGLLDNGVCLQANLQQLCKWEAYLYSFHG